MDFTGSNLRAATFNNTDAQNAIFRGANLEETSFAGARLSGTNFDDAYIGNAHFNFANLTKANLVKVRGVMDANLDLACIDLATTELPDEFDKNKYQIPDGCCNIWANEHNFDSFNLYPESGCTPRPGQ